MKLMLGHLTNLRDSLTRMGRPANDFIAKIRAFNISTLSFY